MILGHVNHKVGLLNVAFILSTYQQQAFKLFRIDIWHIFCTTFRISALAFRQIEKRKYDAAQARSFWIYMRTLYMIWMWIHSTLSNVCSIKFRSKHSTVLLLCLLRNLMEQTLVFFLRISWCWWYESNIRHLWLTRPEIVSASQLSRPSRDWWSFIFPSKRHNII